MATKEMDLSFAVTVTMMETEMDVSLRDGNGIVVSDV